MKYFVVLVVTILISEYSRCDIKEGDRILHINIPQNEKNAENEKSGQVCWSYRGAGWIAILIQI